MEETKSKEEAAIDQINPSSYDRSHLVSDAPIFLSTLYFFATLFASIHLRFFLYPLMLLNTLRQFLPHPSLPMLINVTTS